MEESDDSWRRWVLAASELVKNPAAKVRCMDCGNFLSKEDEKVGASHVDLHIFCTNCGAGEYVLINNALRNVQ